MPMPQYNGPAYAQGPTAVGPYNLQGYQPTFGYNPQQTYMPQTPQPVPSQEPMAIPRLIGRSQVNALNLSASQSNQNAYLVAQLKTPAPVPAYTVPNPNGYYGGQQNCYQSCGC